jgi:c-di-GMP-binding flagellar brake protein YcgR
MFRKKDIPLKIEIVSGGHDNQYLVHSKKEIQYTLHALSQKANLAALYFGDDNRSFLTTILDANANGVWLDAEINEADRMRVLASEKVAVVTSHNSIKIQFSSQDTELDMHDGSRAFHMPLPDTMLRLQRREYFRLIAPAKNPLRCTIPIQFNTTSVNNRKATILDISVGGIALVCEEYDVDLLPGNTYPNCSIELPDVGTLTATLSVRNSFHITNSEGKEIRRAGCEFIGLDRNMEQLLQRYISNMQAAATPNPA